MSGERRTALSGAHLIIYSVSRDGLLLLPLGFLAMLLLSPPLLSI